MGTVIHVAIDGSYAGHIVISDQVKEDSADAISAMRAEGVRRIVMLTGDREEVAREVAGQLGLDEYHAELLPTDKVAQVERLIDEKAAGEGLDLESIPRHRSADTGHKGCLTAPTPYRRVGRAPCGTRRARRSDTWRRGSPWWTRRPLLSRRPHTSGPHPAW